MAHRTLYFDDNATLFIKPEEGDSYEAYKMSDGERALLYFAGRVSLAPTNSRIIVDEPEGYLHESIVNKLWDRLEEYRSDCIFIYESPLKS
jgi:predicted ATPase